MKSITTGEVIAVPIEEKALDVQMKRSLPITKISVAQGANVLRVANWTAYAEAIWLRNGAESWVYSHASQLISYMSAQNESFYASGHAGSDLQISPSGWYVGAISAYVSARGGFTLKEFRGYHSYSEPGYEPIDLRTYNVR